MTYEELTEYVNTTPVEKLDWVLIDREIIKLYEKYEKEVYNRYREQRVN